MFGRDVKTVLAGPRCNPCSSLPSPSVLRVLNPLQTMAEEPQKKPECAEKDCKQEEEKPLKEVNTEEMSRGLQPEPKFPFAEVEDLIVVDEQGNKIRFGDIYKHQKTIIVFVRHFLDYVAKEYVEDLGIIPQEYLQNANVRLVVIGPAPGNAIRNFRLETLYPYTMYCDPDRNVYKALGCIEKIEDLTSKSKHVKSGFIMGTLRSMFKIMQEQRWLGNAYQQGGAFILGPGNEVHYSHIDRSMYDHAPINEILKAAGVQCVSFPNDPRIQTL